MHIRLEIDILRKERSVGMINKVVNVCFLFIMSKKMCCMYIERLEVAESCLG